MKKLLIFLLLPFFLVLVFVPHAVSAGGDLHASPTPVPTERFAPPVITGVNPVVQLSEGNQGQSRPSGSFHPEDLILPNSVLTPPFVELEHQEQDIPDSGGSEDVNCGPAALAAALAIKESDHGRQSPTQRELTSFLSSRGLMYEWGTGVEELVLAAREFGYEGSQHFNDLGFDELKRLLLLGQPIVVPLGTNGPDLPGHFVTLVGITENGKGIILKDPSSGQIVLSIEEFVRLWAMQGGTGMIPSIDPLESFLNQGIPWTGLFSLVTLASLVMGHADSFHLKWLSRELKRRLANPTRMGIGGGPLPPRKPETISVPEYEYQTMYRGLKTEEVEVPEYKTKKVKVGLREIEKQVPQYTTRRVQVGTSKVSKKLPVYSYKKVQIGTRLEKKRIPVTRYKYVQVMTWKKYKVKVPVIHKIGSKKITIGYKNQTRWKRVPMRKKVPYQAAKVISVEVPVFKNEKYISGYRNVVQEVPRYEEKKVLVGYKTVKETVPFFEERRVQVGTKTITRQMPWYARVRLVSGYRDVPSNPVTNLSTKQEKIEAICVNDEVKELLHDHEFEVTDVVFLTGGPGAGYGIEKVENSYSGHSGGGMGSTPWMMFMKILSRGMVWLRDGTNILESPKRKPDAQAIIIKDGDVDNKIIDSILVINKGNEEIFVHSIVVEVDNGDKSRINDQIWFLPFTRNRNVNNRVVLPGNFLIYPLDEKYYMKSDSVELMHIQISTNSERSGFISHEISY